jgi:hypothetical protein
LLSSTGSPWSTNNCSDSQTFHGVLEKSWEHVNAQVVLQCRPVCRYSAPSLLPRRLPNRGVDGKVYLLIGTTKSRCCSSCYGTLRKVVTSRLISTCRLGSYRNKLREYSWLFT